MGRERMLAILLAGLLAAMAPSAFATESDISLEARIVNAPDKGWYASGESVEVVGTLSNSGEATSILVDPSCGEVLKIWNAGSLVIDGTDSCLGQSRGMDIGSSSSTEFDALLWDLKDSEGRFVPSGYYDIELFVAGEELSSIVTVNVQTPVTIPDGLELEVITTSRTGIHTDSSPSIITARLHNTLSYDITLQLDGCELSLNTQLIGSCGPEKLAKHQIVSIAQIPVDLVAGLNEFSISLGDGVLMTNITLNATDGGETTNSSKTDDLQLSLELEHSGVYTHTEKLVSSILIENKGNEDRTLEFTNTCRAEMWIVNSIGNVVMDTLSMKECNNMSVQSYLSPGDEKTYTLPEWSFVDLNGCPVNQGELIIVFEIPEYGLFGTEIINLDQRYDNGCQNQSVEISAEISENGGIYVSPDITTNSALELIWIDLCGLKTKLYGPEGQVDYKATECDFNTTISSKFNNYIFESFIFEADNLTDGEYYIAFETSTQPKISSTVSFTWPISEEESALQNDDDDEPALISPLLVNGSWSATTNQLGTCWLLKSPEEGIITLSETTSVESWSPRVGAFGLYLMTESDPAPECSDFATKSYMVNEVYTEDMPVTSEDKENKTAVVTTEKTLESEISPVVVTAGAVIAGGGILSLLFAVISTNESLRIPATSAGLWFLGLIGRTSETSDGRYQRGRLMGYLTANPGCHFRALMAALEMSNGQITHHLKVLEDEDSIWRRPDGRLVRFYPYTSNLHPGISEDELPLPPLSPDPNSLQGKILRLLDDDGGMRKYPTQAELAHRLDRSQQLVSHHLRTLQKFGLVQKQKMGIKNRYALTKEAIFLLDTTEV